MVKGTTTRTVSVTVSVPREFWYSLGENFDYRELEAYYGPDKCGGNNAIEEHLMRQAILPYLADEAGLPDGELIITEKGNVEVDRKRASDGTFTASRE